MTDYVLPPYRDIREILKKTPLNLHPAQAHGLLCGVLCVDVNETVEWQTLLTGIDPTSKISSKLELLYEISKKQLHEFTFEFQLLLPSDNKKLSERAEGLTLWTQGFLTGLKIMNVPIVDREAGEVTEAINDIIEIAKMNFEKVVSSEEDEIAYVELVEFIRVATILIYHAFHEDDKIKPTQIFARQLH